MISKIINGPDPRDVVEPITVPIAPSDVESDIELEKKNICYESRNIIQAEEIGEGSIVKACIAGKCVYINVGLELFDAAIEKVMIGHRTGDHFEAKDENGCVRAIEIEQVQSVVIPEYSDETICHSQATSATSMEEFEREQRDYYTSMFTQTYLEYYAKEFTDQWIEQCELEIDDTEKKVWTKAWIAYQKKVEEFHDCSVYEEYEGQANEMYEEEAQIYFLQYLAWKYLLYNNSVEEELTIEDTQFLVKVRDEITAYMAEILRPHFKVVWEEENKDVI